MFLAAVLIWGGVAIGCLALTRHQAMTENYRDRLDRRVGTLRRRR